MVSKAEPTSEVFTGGLVSPASLFIAGVVCSSEWAPARSQRWPGFTVERFSAGSLCHGKRGAEWERMGRTHIKRRKTWAEEGGRGDRPADHLRDGSHEEAEIRRGAEPSHPQKKLKLVWGLSQNFDCELQLKTGKYRKVYSRNVLSFHIGSYTLRTSDENRSLWTEFKVLIFPTFYLR